MGQHEESKGCAGQLSIYSLQIQQSSSTDLGGISSWLTSSGWELVIEKDGVFASRAAFPWQLELEKNGMGWDREPASGCEHLQDPTSISVVPHPSPVSHMHLWVPTFISGVQHLSPGSQMHLSGISTIFRISNSSLGSHIHLQNPKCISEIPTISRDPNPSPRSYIHL